MIAQQRRRRHSPLADKIRAAMAAADRPEADAAHEVKRKPVATLTFADLTEEMDVLELVPRRYLGAVCASVRLGLRRSRHQRGEVRQGLKLQVGELELAGPAQLFKLVSRQGMQLLAID